MNNYQVLIDNIVNSVTLLSIMVEGVRIHHALKSANTLII